MKTYSKTGPAPKHRNIQHLYAKMRKGAGVHADKVSRLNQGPELSDWDDEFSPVDYDMAKASDAQD